MAGTLLVAGLAVCATEEGDPYVDARVCADHILEVELCVGQAGIGSDGSACLAEYTSPGSGYQLYPDSWLMRAWTHCAWDACYDFSTKLDSQDEAAIQAECGDDWRLERERFCYDYMTSNWSSGFDAEPCAAWGSVPDADSCEAFKELCGNPELLGEDRRSTGL